MDIRKITASAAALLLCACTANSAPAQTQAGTTAEATESITETSSETAETAAETTSQATAAETTTASSQTEVLDTVAAPEDETEALAPVPDGGYAEAYKAKLRSLIDENKDEDMSTYMFSVYDVGGDETPELFISSGDYHAAAAELFAYIDGSVEEIGYIGSYGETIYMPERKQFDSANGGMGSFYNSIVEFDGRKLIDGISIEAYEGPDYEAEDPDYDDMVEKYFIGERTVTKQEYYKAYEENFTGTYISLGRSYYLNEHGISAVFDDLGGDRNFDELIMSLPTEGEQWGVPKDMAYIDITGSGKELVLTNGYSFNIYAYDKGIRCIGTVPTYSYSPYQYYDEIDIDYESGEPEITFAVNSEKNSVVYISHSGSDTICAMTWKDGMLYPDGEYHAYKLTDGTYYYTIDSKPAHESEYDTYVQGFFADEYKEIEFYPAAVG